MKAVTFEAIKARCLKVVEGDYYDQYVGRPCRGGYRLAVTNGHFAFLEQGPGTQGAELSMVDVDAGDTAYSFTYLYIWEFWAVIERAAKSRAPKKRGKTVNRQIVLACEGGEVTVFGDDQDGATRFEERVGTAPHAGGHWKARVNVDYLLLLRGCDALRVRVRPNRKKGSGTEHQLVFEPVGPLGRQAPWRFALMPCRGEVGWAKEGWGKDAVVAAEAGGAL